MTLSLFECRVSQEIMKHGVIVDKSQKNIEDKDEKVTKAFEEVQQSLEKYYGYHIPIAGLIKMWDRIVKRVKDVSLKEKQREVTKDNRTDNDGASDEDTGKSEQEWENHFKKYGCMEENAHISPLIVKPSQRKRRNTFKMPAAKKQKAKKVEKPMKSTQSSQPSGSRSKEPPTPGIKEQEPPNDLSNDEEIRLVESNTSSGKKKSTESCKNGSGKMPAKQLLCDSNSKSEKSKTIERESIDDTELGDFMQSLREIELQNKQKPQQDSEQVIQKSNSINSKEICKMINSFTGHRPCKTTGLASKPKNVVKFPPLDRFAQRNKQTVEEMDQLYKNLESTVVENSKNIFTSENKSIYFPLIYEKFFHVKPDLLDTCMEDVLNAISQTYE